MVKKYNYMKEIMTTSVRFKINTIGFALTAVLFSLVNVGQASAAPFSTVDCSNPAHVTTLNVPQAECEFLDDLSTQFSDTGWNKTNWDTLSDVGTWGSIVTSGGSITEISATSVPSGTIPASISNLSNLEDLRMSSSWQITGPIPDLSSNTSLVSINLIGNNLTGSLPDISALTQLEYFDVSANQLTGPLHSTLGNPNLVYYDITADPTATDVITGTPDFSNNTLIEEIIIRNNDLTGILDVTNNPLLRTLRIDDNEFGPELPDLSNNTSLTYLILAHNEFYGFIPDHYSTLTSLTSPTALLMSANCLNIDIATNSLYTTVAPGEPTNAPILTPALEAWLTLIGKTASVYLDSQFICGDAETDTDGDGFSDSIEYADALAGGSGDWNDASLTPVDADSDGVPAVIEALQGTDDNDATDYVDTDGDLVPDFIELSDGTNKVGFEYNGYIDTDGDLVPDYIENMNGTDPDDINDYIDTDGGGVPDYIEETLLPLHGLDATDINDASDDNQDSDGDGVSDYIEFLLGYPADNDAFTPTQDMIDALGLGASGSGSGGTGSDDGSELADTGNAIVLTVLVGVSLVASALTVARITKKI